MNSKWLQIVTLELEIDTEMEPTCLQGLPRGAVGGANMHPKWDARGHTSVLPHAPWNEPLTHDRAQAKFA